MAILIKTKDKKETSSKKFCPPHKLPFISPIERAVIFTEKDGEGHTIGDIANY